MELSHVLTDLLANGGLHGFLLVAVIVLWRENRALQAKIDALHEETRQQTVKLDTIQSQTNGKSQQPN